jgi:hypothetical protein
LLPQSAARLVAGGSLLCEISPMIAVEVQRMVEAEPSLQFEKTIPDLAGLPRVVHVRKKA